MRLAVCGRRESTPAHEKAPSSAGRWPPAYSTPQTAYRSTDGTNHAVDSVRGTSPLKMELQRTARYAATVVALAAALAVLSIAALQLQPRGYVSLVYPATGLGAALLWGFGVRWWPAVVLAQFAISLNATNTPAV